MIGILRAIVVWVLALGAAAVGVARGVTRPSADARPAGEQERRERPAWQRWLIARAKTVAGFLVLAGVGGSLVMLSGVVPNRASSGHWAITRWFLELATQRTVSFHARFVPEPPPLDDPRLVLRGGGHFDTGCAPCHGRPGLRQPRVAQAMTPEPPYLPPVIPEWSDRELFYIVKHGIKFAGMPAWPTQERDDEVWAMVSFLRVFADVDGPGYRRLVHGEVADVGETGGLERLSGDELPPVVRESCARCHGIDGLGRGAGAFPRLAGQKAAYLRASLLAYATGARHSGIMEPIAAGLSEDEVEAIVRHYATLPPPPPLDPEDAESIVRGEAIAREGIPGLGVPACADCHGPFPLRRNEHYPILAGQYADYLLLQLELFQAGRRGGTPYAHLMRLVAKGLEPEEMHALALYYASLAGE